MSVHLTEEEQIAVLKSWWKENGKIVVVAVLAAVAGYFTWTYVQDRQRAEAENASERYESLLKLVNVEPGKTLSDADRATALHLAGEFKEKNGKTLYATNAAFFIAKLAVGSADLDQAVKELQWILSTKPDIAIAQLAHVRLARVLLAKESYTEAAAQLADEPSKAFVSEYAEVRGDILKAQGNKAAALTAYEKALETTDPQQQERVMVLQMKADDLRLSVSSALPVESNAQPVVEKAQ